MTEGKGLNATSLQGQWAGLSSRGAAVKHFKFTEEWRAKLELQAEGQPQYVLGRIVLLRDSRAVELQAQRVRCCELVASVSPNCRSVTP